MATTTTTLTINTNNDISHLSDKIIEHNTKQLYYTVRKMKNINRLFNKHSILKKELLDIYKYLKGYKLFLYNDKPTFHLTEGQYTYKIRNKTTLEISNHHFNYLCCCGFINKHKQILDTNGEIDNTILTNINYNFLGRTNNLQYKPIGAFYIIKYDKEELTRIDKRCKQLLDNGITIGNISGNKLRANNCSDLADEVYYHIPVEAYKKKQKEYTELIKVIDSLIAKNGYTTKQEIYNNYKININKSYKNNKIIIKEIDKLFKIFKNQLNELYRYKPPTKEEKAKYNLKNQKYIIIRWQQANTKA